MSSNSSNSGSYEQILSHISKDEQKSIEDLFKKVDKNKEFELIFFSKKRDEMNKEKYIMLLKFMKAMKARDPSKYKISGPDQTLDVIYNSEQGTSYRITIEGIDEIKIQLNRVNNIQNRNYVIYKFLMQMIKKDSKKIKLYLKTRDQADNIDIDDLNIRARLSDEIDLTEYITGDKKMPKEYENSVITSLLKGDPIPLDLGIKVNQSISYRLKERTSLYFEGDVDSDSFCRIDLTNTKTVDNIKKLYNIYSNYELEIEYGVKKSSSVDVKHLKKIYSMSETIIKLLQQSAFIIGNKQSESVINFYKDISGITEKISNLVARQPVSLEVQHATEILPNRYAITDKADGDRYFAIIMESNLYLISSNLNVRDTGIVLSDSLGEKYNGTIMDGELIYIPSERRHVLMVFDCLKIGKTDIRGETKLMKRLEAVDTLIEECFIFKDQLGFKFKDLPVNSGEFNIDKNSDFYGKELKRFYTALNNDIQKVKQYLLIRRKYFMPVTGAKNWEVFKYSVEYWNTYTMDSDVKFPYLLDGLIYQPLEQPYITNAQESKYADYKWKPPAKNSVDFYIEFVKDKITNKILDVYDNSNDDLVRNKPYRICKLHVGQTLKGKEYPVPFVKNGVSDCYIYLENGEARDDVGDIITDKTVVEFYYQNDPNIIPQQRWIPIKTRYDKTESVERYGKRYGNFSTTADRIWRSIINPVLMSDMIELAKGNTDKRDFYDQKIAAMNKTIDHALIVEVNKENKYYQKQTRLASTMRDYHNFIKSNMIYTYCNKMYNSNIQLSVLDIACGRGGDINKFYYTAVASYVGIDIDAEGIKSPVDGAVSRYNRQRKKKPNFPDMYFIQADGRALLEYDTQVKALSGMDDRNKKLLERFFPSPGTDQKKTLFDRINCQFAVHYFLENEQSWKNFKINLNAHLRNGGYFIATTFDAHQVVKAIGKGRSYATHLDDEEGNKKLFFEVVKKYDDSVIDKIENNQIVGVGNPIDLHAAWMFNEGVYFTEYLVDVNFMREELLRDCDMDLVDTGLFQDQMTQHERFFKESADFESTDDTKSYLRKTRRYYEDTEINIKCRAYTNLNRYYVFRKNDSKKSNKNTTKNMKGGKTDTHADISDFNFSDHTKYKIPDMVNYDAKSSLVNSIHKILVSHSLIPKTVYVDDFVKDQGIRFSKDLDIDPNYIKTFAKNVNIDHDIEGVVKNVMKGVDLYIVERDCNDFYDIQYAKGTPRSKSSMKNGRAIILMKDGLSYKPVMRKEMKGVRGMFGLDDPLVKYLEDNGEEL